MSGRRKSTCFLINFSIPSHFYPSQNRFLLNFLSPKSRDILITSKKLPTKCHLICMIEALTLKTGTFFGDRKMSYLLQILIHPVASTANKLHSLFYFFNMKKVLLTHGFYLFCTGGNLLGRSGELRNIVNNFIIGIRESCNLSVNCVDIINQLHHVFVQLRKGISNHCNLFVLQSCSFQRAVNGTYHIYAILVPFIGNFCDLFGGLLGMFRQLTNLLCYYCTPRPASPARALSMEAFRDKRFV